MTVQFFLGVVMRLLFFVLAISTLGVVQVAPVSAQQNHDVAHWLERDAAILLNIDDVRTTYERLSELDLLANPRFQKAISMLSDERFPILEPRAIEDSISQLLELDSLVQDVKQISVAVHQFTDSEFIWTVFARADPETLEQVANCIRGVNKQVSDNAQLDNGKSNSNRQLENDEADFQREKLAPQPLADDQPNEPVSDINDVESRAENLIGCKLQIIGDWLLLSNHPTLIDELPKRIKDKKFRSLGAARKYKAIALLESPLRSRDARISVYGNPQMMRKFIPRQTESRWKRQKPREMPSCGMNIVLTDAASRTSDSDPIVLADAVVRFTQPPSGYGKLFSGYRPVEIPPLVVKPIEIHAYGRDEVDYNDTAIQSYDEEFGIDAAANYWKQHFQNAGIDVFADAMERREAFVGVRFVSGQNPLDQPGLLTLEKVKDYDAAFRFAEGVAQNAQTAFQIPMTKSETNGNVWWRREKLEPGQVWSLPFDRMKFSRMDHMNSFGGARVLTPEWWIQGDEPAISQQVELLANQDEEDFGQPIRYLIEDLSRRLKSSGPPVMIKYYSGNAWQENLDNIEQQYAMTNGEPTEVKISLGENVNLGLTDLDFLLNVAPPNRDADADQNDKSNAGAVVQEPANVIEIHVRPSVQLPGEPGGKLREGVLLQSQVVTFIRSMPLGQRNEDGYRFEVKRRKDLQKAIELMILKSVSETFPRQLFLYTQGEGHFRVLGAVYPAESVESENELP